MNQVSLYESAGFYLLRAPHLPAQVFRQMTTAEEASEPPGDDLATWLAQRRQQSYEVLVQLLENPVIEQALLVASSDIAAGIACIRAGDRTSRRARQAFAGIFRYLGRMCTRPTPFGLFSGVAMGVLGETTTARLGTPTLARIRTRPDMSWLLAVIQQVEENPAWLPHLEIQMNRSVYLAGARAVLPSADIYGKGDNRSVVARATRVFRAIQELAREPLPYATLRQQVGQAFPQADEQMVERLLQQLWETHFFISNLRPPLTSARPERYLLEKLRDLPGAEPLTTALAEILCLSTEIDAAGAGGSVHLLTQLAEKQHYLVSDQKGRPYQIDAALTLEATQLTSEVGAAVADATEALLRMGHMYAAPHLRDYHRLFIERYGMHAEVPLLELLSPERGLDAPATYLEPPRAFQATGSAAAQTEHQERRDRLLSSLLATALHEHREEIELTDALLEQLTRWRPEPGRPAWPTVEMYMQLHAASREALDRGEWRGVIAPATLVPGGRTFSRFFDLLGAEDLRQLQDYARREADRFPDALFAELSYLPKSGHGANVAIRPVLHSYEIVVNTAPSVPPERVIALSDLVVGAEQDGFSLRSLRYGKRVVVTQSHMLNSLRAPNVCRFLLEVSHDVYPAITSFNWGPFARAPFLPRVVRNRIVLKPAQWNIQAGMIEQDGPGDEETRFFAGLQHWRRRWRVPRYVYLQELDNRLLLDLEHPLSVAEMQRTLRKVGADTSLSLQEMLPDFDHLWLRDDQERGYLAEVVVPLVLKESASARPAIQAEPVRNVSRHPVPASQRLQLPGDDWTFLKLYAPAKQHDEVISGPLREFVQHLGQQRLFDSWFFIRYADPEPHLRVRFHAANRQTRDELLLKALAWGRSLADAGWISNLVLDTYSREVERYGGPLAIEALEEVFSANSNAVAEIVAAVYTGQITLETQAINILTLDQLFTHWGLDLAQRLHNLQERTGKYEQSEAFRAQRRLLTELLQPWDPTYDPALQAQGTQLVHLGEIQRDALQHAATFLRELARQGELWVSEDSILASLAHMHLNRLQGIDRAREQACYALWRQTLESIQRRPARLAAGHDHC